MSQSPLKFLYDEKGLADAIVGPRSPLRIAKKSDEPVELILGITRQGSSHLLLTWQQVQKIEHFLKLPRPQGRAFSAGDFESLSPIAFFSAEEFTKKLAFLKPKATRKGKKSGSGAPEDSSQANRGYTIGIDNLYRGAFEHGRVIYRILNDTFRDDSNPKVYGCDNTAWTPDICISSLVFNTKGVDDRLTSEKVRNPHVLDIGFCNTVLPSITPEYSTAIHIVHSGNIFLGRKGPKQPFRHGDTESIMAAMLPNRIQNLFQGRKSPMILLVNKQEETMNFLRNMGVDVSQWRYGLRGLLFGSKSNSQSSNYHNSRSRSRSPSRRNHQDYNSRYPSSHQDQYNTRRPPPYAPVYVLDIHQLYVKLMQAQDAQLVVDIARRLELPVEDGWCAGNEAPLLIDIWRSMISGPPIDDQRDLRTGVAAPETEAQVNPTPGPLTAPSSDGPIQQQSGGGSDSEDSEADPNAYFDQTRNQNQRPAQKAPEAPKAVAYGDWDQSDYGSDSEESD
ncbi:hypothetical protein BJ912DRAFT_941248 [Pholiota molesta]|nr:hypothetical protein BJ912DRAFT_941248 [Pholiota molesta]